MRRLIFISTGLLILILASCTKYTVPTPPCPEGTISKFAAVIQPIFDSRCISCHSGNQAPDLSAGWSYDELIDGGYVDTDFPCESILYQKFSDTHDGRATEDQVLQILGWIQDGAQNN